MELTINEDNLKCNEVHECITKVRVILVDENNQLLIANYGNVILLPGGKVENGETILTAINREINEELGQYYSNEELDYFMTLNYYQKGYPKRDGTFQNRLVKTHYFVGQYKDIKKDNQELSEKERNSNFSLELISLEDLENIVLSNINSNPRNIYFQRELLAIFNIYKKRRYETSVKKLKLK